MELLKKKVIFTTTFEKEFVRDIKEQFCAVRQKNQSFDSVDWKKYCLPDGKTIEVKNE